MYRFEKKKQTETRKKLYKSHCTSVNSFIIPTKKKRETFFDEKEKHHQVEINSVVVSCKK